MSQTQTAVGADRLPWLPDEPSPPKTGHGSYGHRGSVLAAILLVAGAAYWIGAHGGEWSTLKSRPAGTSTTVPLPKPEVLQPRQPQVSLEPVPEISPEPEREVHLARPRIETTSVAPQSAPLSKSTEPASEVEDESYPGMPARSVAAPTAKSTPTRVNKPMAVWPAWQSQGADGRIVRIGAFGSRLQAKLGWRHMVRAYPAVAHLKATVVTDSNSRGRAFYRFQIGTTSQAHSEVLCQWMEKIHFSCAVVGLPWKPKGVER